MPCKILIRLRLLLPMVAAAMSVLPSVAASQPFTYSFVRTNLPDLNYAAISFADVDRDGDLDLVASGNVALLPPFIPWASIGRNLGIEQAPGGSVRLVFEEAPLGPSLWQGSTAWTDFDRDGAPDFILTGATRNEPPFDAETRLYRNVGDGTFEHFDAGFVGVYGSAATWGDFDNDGDDDLLLTGVTPNSEHTTILYRNENGVEFTETPTGLPGVAFGAVDWADYDDDGDLDVLLMGAERTGQFVTRIYRNDGNGAFSDTEAGLAGLAFGTASWGDLDNDGDLDVLLSGGRISPELLLEGETRIYRNDAGNFTDLAVPIFGAVYGAASWGDYDGDGRLDVLVTGEEAIGGFRAARVYQNRGQDAFAHIGNLPGMAIATAIWGDYDGDRDLDVVLTGLSEDRSPFTGVYRNDRLNESDLPTPPSGLVATVDGNNVMLSWEDGASADPPNPRYTYALRVGTVPGGTDVVSPMADPASGRRYVPSRGIAGAGRRRLLKNLPRGAYYWSVQSIDQSYNGSAFADEGTFLMTSDQATTGSEDIAGDIPTSFGLRSNFPNPFAESTTIVYDVATHTDVELKIYDLLGKEVRVLWRGTQPAGRHEVLWDGLDSANRRIGAGVYFARLRSGSGSWIAPLVRVE